jgi:hypothetical protein
MLRIDFTSMYDKFVHADMKQRQSTTLLFDYMNGNVIFDELNEFTDRRGIQRSSGL